MSTFDLHPEVVDVILAARRRPTKSVYACHWDKFVAWCITKQVDPLHAKLSKVLLFFLSLARTLLNVTCSLFQPFYGCRTILHCSKHQLGSVFLKDYNICFPLPPSSFIMPQWGFNLILTFLIYSPFKPMHSLPLKLLTRKTAFLVAITSARGERAPGPLC